LSLINTINSIVASISRRSSRNLRRRQVEPRRLLRTGGQTDRAAPRSAVAADPSVKIPVSGIGRHCVVARRPEFIALGAGSLQVCTAVMHYGFRIVEDLIDGLANWMDERGHRTLAEVRGRALPRVTKWEELDLNYHLLAHIDQDKCIKCEPVLDGMRGWRASGDPAPGEEQRRAGRGSSRRHAWLQSLCGGVSRAGLHHDGAGGDDYPAVS